MSTGNLERSRSVLLVSNEGAFPIESPRAEEEEILEKVALYFWKSKGI